MTVEVKPAGAKRDQVPEEGPSQLVQQKERQEEVYRPQRGPDGRLTGGRCAWRTASTLTANYN